MIQLKHTFIKQLFTCLRRSVEIRFMMNRCTKKKIFPIILLCLTLSIFLAGCYEKKPDTAKDVFVSETTKEDKDDPVETIAPAIPGKEDADTEVLDEYDRIVSAMSLREKVGWAFRKAIIARVKSKSSLFFCAKFQSNQEISLSWQ